MGNALRDPGGAARVNSSVYGVLYVAKQQSMNAQR